MRVEEKLSRKQDTNGGGRGNTNRGRAGRANDDKGKPSEDKRKIMNVNARQRGGGIFGYSIGNGVFTSKFFNCWAMGHQSHKFPKKEIDFTKMEKRVHFTQGGEEEIK